MTPAPKKKPRQRKLERDRAREAAKKETSPRHAAAKKAAKAKRVKAAGKRSPVESAARKRTAAAGEDAGATVGKKTKPTTGSRAGARPSTPKTNDRARARTAKPSAARSVSGAKQSRRAATDEPVATSARSTGRRSGSPSTMRDAGRAVAGRSARASDRATRSESTAERSAPRSGAAARKPAPTQAARVGAPQQRDRSATRPARHHEPRQHEPRVRKPHTPVTNTAAITSVEADDAVAVDVTSWATLGVAGEFLPLLRRMGISAPFPIQELTLPDALARRDVLGRAQTGSGKTLAFGLAMLTRLAHRKAQPHRPLGLVLVPTRELAMQVTDALTPFAQAVGLDIRLIAGGMPYARQIDALRRAVPVLVATPGRLNDLIAQGQVRLEDIEITVLDEADQMCDMGFAPQIVEVLDLTPPDGQRLLFSATLDRDVDAIVHAYLNDAITHSTVTGEARVATMEHFLFLVHSEDKADVVARIASRAGKTMLFGRTQLGVERIANELMHHGVACGALHGGKSQAVRTKTLQQFKDGTTHVLVATDVAARGIHVEGVTLVVHVDPPKDPKDYVHRAGRTARAGERGTVVTIVAPRQQKAVAGMMARAGVTPEVVRIRTSSPELVRITGAREPSGTPWHPPSVKPPQRRGPRPGNRRTVSKKPEKARFRG